MIRRWLVISLLCGAFLGLLMSVITSFAPRPVQVIPGGQVYYPTIVPYPSPHVGLHILITARPTVVIHPIGTPRP